MAQIDSGSSVAGKANVDSNFNLQVRNPTNPSQVGGVGLIGLLDDGTSRVDSPNTPYAKRVKVSEGGRLAVGQDTPFFSANFNATALNSANWKTPVTTQTVTIVNNSVVLNGSSITTLNTNSAVQTYRYVPLVSTFDLRLEANLMYQVSQVNDTIEFGLLSAALPGAAAPTDGVFFRKNSSNELRGVINFNGVETQTATIPQKAVNTFHNYKIVINERSVEFWIDDALMAEIDLVTAITGQGNPFFSGTLPAFTARYIIGTATGAANQVRITDVNVWTLDGNLGKNWGHINAGQGRSAYQGQDGGTMGSSANYANSANPTAAVPTNTTAALGSGLGGQFWETDTLAATTDGIISSFQNPAGSTTVPGRTLYITGVKIDSYVQTALTGGGYNAQWSLAFGHTAVSLATAESLTAGTKAPRRVALGSNTVAAGATTLTQLSTITARFDGGPIVLNPGEFIQTVKKKVGTAPSAGVIAHTVTFDGYYE